MCCGFVDRSQFHIVELRQIETAAAEARVELIRLRLCDNAQWLTCCGHCELRRSAVVVCERCNRRRIQRRCNGHCSVERNRRCAVRDHRLEYTARMGRCDAQWRRCRHNMIGHVLFDRCRCRGRVAICEFIHSRNETCDLIFEKTNSRFAAGGTRHHTLRYGRKFKCIQFTTAVFIVFAVLVVLLLLSKHLLCLCIGTVCIDALRRRATKH